MRLHLTGTQANKADVISKIWKKPVTKYFYRRQKIRIINIISVCREGRKKTFYILMENNLTLLWQGLTLPPAKYVEHSCCPVSTPLRLVVLERSRHSKAK
jgi:capsule polysaccharide export protein KpsC/LpsZ